MNLLTVILNESSEYIYNRLDKELFFFHKEGTKIKKEIYETKNSVTIEFQVELSSLKDYDLDDFRIMFFHYIGNALSDIIVTEIEDRFVQKILTGEYYYFSSAEKNSVLKHLKNIQEGEEYKYGNGVTYKISRKAKVLHQIIEYLRGNSTIHLEGFLRFRLKEYLQELEENIDRAVEDFFMEKEYYEFIRLLKYFVDIQEAKIDIANVVMEESGKYHLYDKMNRLINNEYLEDLASEMADKDISYDDLLISSLITLAPNQVVIHFEGKVKNKEIIETIKSVFSDRVCICNGCKLCMTAQSVKQE